LLQVQNLNGLTVPKNSIIGKRLPKENTILMECPLNVAFVAVGDLIEYRNFSNLFQQIIIFWKSSPKKVSMLKSE